MLGLGSSARATQSAYLEDPTEISRYVRARAIPLEWPTVFGDPERLIYFGERHPDARPKAELVAHMNEAAAAGITHLAIEMLGEDRRDLIDRFGRGEATEIEMVRAFSNDWGPADRGFYPEEYAQVLAAAKKAGIKVEPLDFSLADKDKAWDSCVGKKTKPACQEDETKNRDDHMMSSLARLLSQKDIGRVLAWTGAWHACALEQATKLRESGIASRSYYFVTKGVYEKSSGIIHYVDAIEKFGWSSRRLLIPTQGVQACFAGLIYAPGTEVAPARR